MTDESGIAAARKLLEPDAVWDGMNPDTPMSDVAAISIAISLRKIVVMMQAEAKKPKPSIFEQTIWK